MRDSNKTEYKKGIRITEDDYIYIQSVKYKKSMAGKLKEIIKFYKENKKI